MADTRNTQSPQWDRLADDLSAAVQGFLNYGRARNLSPRTLGYYHYRLQSFERFTQQNAPGIAPKDVRQQLIRDFISSESQHNSPSTANHGIIALRAFFNFLVRDGFLDHNPLSGMQKVRQRKSIIETFSMDQIEAVLSTCKREFLGLRDRAIILTLLDCGLRVSELCGLTLSDIGWNEQVLRVVGKGDIERQVPFGCAVRNSLVQYQARRGELETESLFVTVLGDPLNRFRVRDMIGCRCKNADIAGVRCSPHTFRHTFAVSYLRNGGDVFSLQNMLGHSDLTMTRRYAELSQADVRDKHRLYSPADRLGPTKAVGGRRRIR